MTAAGLLLAFGVIFAAGSGLARLLAGRQHAFYRAEFAALTWLLGAGFVSLALWVLGLVLSGWWLVSAVTLGAAFLAAASGRHGVPSPPGFTAREPLRTVDWLILAVLAAQAVFIACWASRIALGWDGLMIWEFKARLAFESGGALPAAYFSDADRAWSHPNYPLHLPYLETWLYRCLGRVDQAWVRLIGPLYYFAAAALLATGTVRLGGSRRTGLAAAAALFFVPYLFGGLWGVLAGYADFPLGVVFLAALIHLPGLRDTKPGDERLFAVLAALLVWGKREGRFLWVTLIVLAALTLLPRGRWRALLLVAAPGALLLAGFDLFLAVMHTVRETTYLPATWANLHANGGRLIPIAQRFARELLDLENWSLLWPGVALALGALVLRGQPARAARLASALLLPMAAYALAFVLTTWSDFGWHIDLALPRLLLHLAPAAVLIIALAVPPAFSLATSADTKEDQRP